MMAKKSESDNKNLGINMKRYCRAHEQYVTTAEPTQALLEFHLEMLRRIQHERLIHLIVTLMTVIAEFFTVAVVVLAPERTGVIGAIVMLGLAVLLLFYFLHYFFLENTVQRWYVIADTIRDTLLNPPHLNSSEGGDYNAP